MKKKASCAMRPCYERADFSIIDCHVHGPGVDGSIFQWAPLFRSYEEYLRYLARAGIQIIIQNSISAVMAKRESDLEAGNTTALRLAMQKKVRGIVVIPACITHPSFLKQARRDLLRFRRAGSCWAGEMCPYLAGYTPAHPRFKTMLKMLADENFIFQIHSQPVEVVRDILNTCPGLTVVLSHLGQREDMEAKFNLARQYRRLLLDISGSGYDRLGMLEKGIQMGLENQILFGSDFPINDPNAVLARLFAADFTPEVLNKILGTSVQKMFYEHGIELPLAEKI